MKKSKRVRNGLIAILAIAVMIALYIGCDRNETSPLMPSTDNTQMIKDGGDIMYIETCDGTRLIPVMTSSLVFAAYLPEDPDFTRAVQDDEVQPYIEKLHTLGYEIDLAYSYKQQGTAVPALMPDMPDPLPAGIPDTLEVRIVVLTMRNIIDSAASVATIAYIESPNAPQLPPLIHAAIHSFIRPPDSDLESYDAIDLTGGAPAGPVIVWIKELVGPFDSKGDDNSIASWSWKRWWKCSVARAAGICAGSLVGCTISTAAYPLCVGTSCAAGAVAGAVSCAVEQWIE